MIIFASVNYSKKEDMTTDEKYMLRALTLASMAKGNTSPNPMVGAVIVKEGKIIAEGYHHRCGCAHAEIEAINSVKDTQSLQGAEMYVSLEPCAHWGKQPPCADRLSQLPLKRVIIGCLDSNPLVSGKGIEIIKKAGIAVTTGVLERQARGLNKYFFTYFEKKRPYITLKWAQTADGFIDISRQNNSNERFWITNSALKIASHALRAANDCILVGRQTVQRDNPQLNIRHFYGQNPLRIVIDSSLRITESSHILADGGDTIVFNSLKEGKREHITYVKIDFCDNVPWQIIHYIYSIGKNSLIIEGGKQTLLSFIKEGLWDEANIYVGEKRIKEGLSCPQDKIKKFFSCQESYGPQRIEYYFNV
jgi:riboflavin biosynthesis protein RibD